MKFLIKCGKGYWLAEGGTTPSQSKAEPFVTGDAAREHRDKWLTSGEKAWIVRVKPRASLGPDSSTFASYVARSRERAKLAPIAVRVPAGVFVGDRKVLDAKGALQDWTLSEKASPIASKRGYIDPLCYLPETYEAAIAWLRHVHSCFVVWRNQPYSNPAPFGTVFVRLDAPIATQYQLSELYVRREHASRVNGYRAFLGDQVDQDGAKFGTWLGCLFSYREPNTIALDPRWVGRLAVDLNAFVAWQDGKKPWRGSR